MTQDRSCDVCGTSADPDASFCKVCGVALPDLDVSSEGVPDTHEAQPIGEFEVPIKFKTQKESESTSDEDNESTLTSEIILTIGTIISLLRRAIRAVLDDIIPREDGTQRDSKQCDSDLRGQKAKNPEKPPRSLLPYR